MKSEIGLGGLGEPTKLNSGDSPEFGREAQRVPPRQAEFKQISMNSVWGQPLPKLAQALQQHARRPFESI